MKRKISIDIDETGNIKREYKGWTTIADVLGILQHEVLLLEYEITKTFIERDRQAQQERRSGENMPKRDEKNYKGIQD
jgi:hypothetical protein